MNPSELTDAVLAELDSEGIGFHVADKSRCRDFTRWAVKQLAECDATNKRDAVKFLRARAQAERKQFREKFGFVLWPILLSAFIQILIRLWFDRRKETL